MSLSDLKERAKKHRSLKLVKKAFCRSTNTSNWDEAQDRFSYHASEDKLCQFLTLDFNKGTPEAFKSFCHSALQSELTSTPLPDSFLRNGATAYIIDCSCLNVSHADIKDSGIPFDGITIYLLPPFLRCLYANNVYSN